MGAPREFTALDLARAVKRRLVRETGLEAQFIYIQTPEGVRGTRKMGEYGFAGPEDADAGLLAEEAYGAFDTVIEQLIGEGIPLRDRWDQTHGCELVFYDY